MKKHVIFIGNGPNRITEEENTKKFFSPSALLSNTFINYNQVSLELMHEDFSYKFEVLLNLLIKNSDYEETYNKCISNLKKYFSKIYNKKIIYKEILDYYKAIFSIIDISNFEAILTTNYDKFLYKLLNARIVKCGRKDGVYKYSINENHDKFLFYIHGNLIESNHKICAGYLAYTRVCKRLFSNIKIYNMKLNSNKTFDDKISNLPDWSQYFFRNNVHIVGYRLSRYERDIRSILTFRSYIIKRYGYLDNKIYFYHISVKDEKKENYYKSFKAFNINIVEIEADSYKDGYKKVFEKIKEISSQKLDE